jgi:molecular chaperone GrpE
MLAAMGEPVDGDDPERDGAKDEGAEGASDAKEAKADPPAAAAAPPPAKDPLEEAKADIAKLRDQLLRTAADYDNYRKRSRRDVDDAQKKGSEELLRILLPVFDNLERAVLHAEQAADAKAIAEGVRMVLKQFGDTLGRAGIQRVPGVGEPFDPMVHEAVQQVESTEAKPGTVIAEVQPGYRMGDRLIRAAMVVVAKSPQTTSKPPPEPN